MKKFCYIYHLPSSFICLSLCLLISVICPKKVFSIDEHTVSQMALLKAEAQKGSWTPNQIMTRLDEMLPVDVRFAPLMDGKGNYLVPPEQRKYVRTKDEKAWMLKTALELPNFQRMSTKDHHNYLKLITKHLVSLELDDGEIAPEKDKNLPHSYLRDVDRDSFSDELSKIDAWLKNNAGEVNKEQKNKIFQDLWTRYLVNPGIEKDANATAQIKKLISKHLENNDVLATQSNQLTLDDIARHIGVMTSSDADRLTELMGGPIPWNFNGSNVTEIPDVVGKKIVDAVPLLEKSHLRIQTKLILTGDKEKANIVASQDKTSGEKVEWNTTVTLKVWRFDPAFLKVSVPDVVGIPFERASAILKEAGMSPDLHESVTSDENEANSSRIIEQSPQAGWELPPGSTVSLSYFLYDPSAPATACVELKNRYKKAMTTRNPYFDIGRSILAKADALNCWFLADAEKHYAQTSERYEKAVKEQTRKEQTCQELYQQYKKKMATKGNHVDFARGKQILDQARQCDWYERAQSHYAQSTEKYEASHARRRADICLERKRRFNDAVSAARNNDYDINRLMAVNSVLSSATGCPWYEAGKHQAACLEGELKGTNALNESALDVTAHWVQWGVSKKCPYAKSLSTSLEQAQARKIQTQHVRHTVSDYQFDDDLDQQKLPVQDSLGDIDDVVTQVERTTVRCQELAREFDAAIVRANQTLDTGGLESVLAASQNCAWYPRAIGMMPCVQAEYNALNAFNRGDMEHAILWTNQGRSENCTYVQRLNGLINQRLAQQQQRWQQETLMQETPQTEKGFWDIFGDSLAQGLEGYNRQMNAPPAGLRSAPVQHRQQSAQPPLPTGPNCGQMNAQMLAACRAGTIFNSHFQPPSRWKQLGCQVSGELDQCIKSQISQSLEGSWTNPDNWKLRRK